MSQKVQDSALFYQKYQIESEIGRGASGVCYKVKKISDGKTYALKKISSTSIKKNNIKGAYNQVNILSSLEHPNIIKHHESFMDDKQLYIVMQYAPKGDLHTILKKRKIKQQYYQENQLWSMIRQLLSALQYLHNKNIIHRDVKTLNIFVDQNNRVIVGDLGVSKILKTDLGLYSRVGTPLYLAPQIIKYQKYDFKADVWGLGCVSYLLATLNHPFQGKNIISLGQNIVNTQPKPIQKYSPNIHKIILQMLQKNHLKRLSPSQLLKKYFIGSQKIIFESKTNQPKKLIQNCLIEAKTQKQIEIIKQKQYQAKKQTQKQISKRYLSSKKNQNDSEIMIPNNKVTNLRNQRRFTYKVGNFLSQIEKQQKKVKAELPFCSNKIFQNTIVIKPKKSIKEEQIDFGNGNEQVTKYQKQSTSSLKKPFQSQHNLRPRESFNLSKNQFSQKKLQVYHKIQPKTECMKIKQNNFMKSLQCFQPYVQNSKQTFEDKVNVISIRKIPTETKYTSQNQSFRNSKQYSVMNLNSVTTKQFVRNSQQIGYSRQSRQENKGLFVDISKIPTQTAFWGQKIQPQGIGRYRQRPKSSIGKKDKTIQNSVIKPKRKENLYSNFYALVQTKILKKPQVIVL